MRVLHDGSRGDTGFFPAFAADENVWARLNPPRLTSPATTDTDEAPAPANRFEVRGARRVVGEYALEFREGSREREILWVEHGPSFPGPYTTSWGRMCQPDRHGT